MIFVRWNREEADLRHRLSQSGLRHDLSNVKEAGYKRMVTNLCKERNIGLCPEDPRNILLAYVTNYECLHARIGRDEG